jgi:hypothetical protein
MERKKWLGILGVLGIAVAVAAAIGTPRHIVPSVEAALGVPDTAEAREVQTTISRAYEIEARAARTFDTSEFASVYINDPRGGALDPALVELIADYGGRPSDAAGFLDYKLAYYACWREGALRLEQMWDKAAREGRGLTLEEMQSLRDRSGRPASPRAPEEMQGTQLEFKSIAVSGDTATAVYDDGPRLNRATLVKVDGVWYIAGVQGLQMHP